LYDIAAAGDSPIAREALERIQVLFAIEAEVRGRGADERRSVRQARAGPILEDLQRWFQSTLSQLSRKSPLAIAMRYALTRWTALTRYRDDGRLELENNAAERCAPWPSAARIFCSSVPTAAARGQKRSTH
jgi:transposase